MDKDAVDIGSRVELFVDDWLIDRTEGVALQLQQPVKKEVVLSMDRPWEGPTGACYTIVHEHAGTVRLYYRGDCPKDSSDKQVTCLAESTDGVHFERPTLGLYEWDGAKANNIVWQGIESHNLSPLVDANPYCPPEQRYKAVGGPMWKLYGLCSPDGVHWKKIQDDPLDYEGAFDSHNVAFWDEVTGCYRSYSRYFEKEAWPAGVRAIQSATSDDFIHWTKPQPNLYAEGVPLEHFYTNATQRCPGAPHLFLSFPKRFVPDRKKVERHPHDGLSEAVFMSSRDGVHWDRRFMEAWVRPGLDERNWTERSNMPAWGILETTPGEFSMYISEHYRWDDCRLRRMTVRRHGFVAVHAPYAGGEFTTRPVVFSGKHLVLNYSTSVVGSIQVELQDAVGKPVADHTLDDMDPLYGDELDAVVTWKSGSDLSPWTGKPVRFRFVMKDADLYAIRATDPSPVL